MTKKRTQLELLMEFFEANPSRDIPHPEIVDWATQEWKKRTGSNFRDPDRGIRMLYQKGYLIKIKKGVYRYEPSKINNTHFEDFTAQQKKKILERDNYKCIICGHGPAEGMELHVDHIKAKELGGKATIDNGQTLCSKHNIMKMKFSQTETGKKMFLRLLQLAQRTKNKQLEIFCLEILEVYEKHKINDHIK